MRDDAGSRRTILVSFSGIDGAGKSTQLETLALRVRQDGLRVLIVRFWDDVARLKGMRETSGHKIFGGDQGVGTPEAPINRRDKNVQSPCVRMLTMFVQRPHISFLLDADPVEARARKPEYPLEFLRLNRESYLRLANLLGGFTVMSPKPVQEIAAEVAAHAVRKLSYEIPERTEGQLAVRAASSIE